MDSNSYQWSNEKAMPKRVAGMYDMDGINMLNAKVDSFVKMFGQFNVNAISNTSLSCDLYRGTHMSSECQIVEQVQFTSNFITQQNNTYSNKYNASGILIQTFPRWQS